MQDIMVVFFGTSFNFDNKQTIYAVLNCFNENHNKSEVSLVSIDLLTGKMNWSVNLQRKTIGSHVLDVSQPVSDDNLIYVLVNRGVSSFFGKRVRMKVKTCLEAYEIKTGQLKWSRFISKQKSFLDFTISYRKHNEFILPMLPSLVIKNGYLWVHDGINTLACFEPTGVCRWLYTHIGGLLPNTKSHLRILSNKSTVSITNGKVSKKLSGICCIKENCLGESGFWY